jgi:flagellar biosynthetic protein FliQ
MVSSLQAVTSINEATLSFVPKLLGVAVALAFFGPWMLDSLVAYTAVIFSSMASVGR